MTPPGRYHPVAIQDRVHRPAEWHRDAIRAASCLDADSPATEAHLAGMSEQEPLLMLVNQLCRMADLHIGRYGVRLAESPEHAGPFRDLVRACRSLSDDSGQFDPGAVLEMIECALERGGFDAELNPLPRD